MWPSPAGPMTLKDGISTHGKDHVRTQGEDGTASPGGTPETPVCCTSIPNLQPPDAWSKSPGLWLLWHQP